MSPTHGRTRQDTCVSEDPTHSGGIVINLGLPTTLVSLLPQDIDINPNSNGLPGIGQLRSIVGASMTVGLILAVLALVISAIVWALGANSSNPHLAGRGKVGVLVGVGAAIITGASVALVNFFWNVGQAV
jgi:hypothetical protein